MNLEGSVLNFVLSALYFASLSDPESYQAKDEEQSTKHKVQSTDLGRKQLTTDY